MTDTSWAETLKKDLETCLKNVQSSGSFAHFEVLKNVPNPRLHITDVGPIDLPLSEIDAKAIASASHQAPFGNGTETIIDMNVRKTWQLSPSEFSLNNGLWEDLMESVVQKVRRELGLSETGIRAELYKLLLYEEGAMFKPHKDSEKSPGMFGTLIIALPSKHEGGEVCVAHAGRKRVLETSHSSESDYSFLTWYSDVIHEVKPVLSGHRLVLTYNLIHDAASNPRSAANTAADITELTSLLLDWQSCLNDTKKDVPQTLAYLFEHEHTNASLSYETLRGHDQKVASQLKDACREAGFYFCLANCERKVIGDCGPPPGGDWFGINQYDQDSDDEAKKKVHKIKDEFEREMSLLHVVELDGKKVSENVDYDEELIIQEEPFESLEPDDEDYEGHTGNEGVFSTTHFYRRTVGIIMPPSSRVPFFLQGHKSHNDYGEPQINFWLDRLFNAGFDSSQKAREEIEEICTMIVSDTKRWNSGDEGMKCRSSYQPFTAAVLERVFVAAVELDDYALFMDAFKLCSGKLPVQLYCDLGTMMQRHQKKKLREGTISELRHLKNFAQRYEALLGLSRGFLNGKADNIWPKFFVQELHHAIATMVFNSAEDGVALAERALLQLGEHKELFDFILPAVERNIKSTPMAVAFLTEMLKAAAEGKIDESHANRVFKDLINDLTLHFSLEDIDLTATSSEETRDSDEASSAAVVAHPTGEHTAALLFHCFFRKSTSELSQLLSTLIKETQSLRVHAFHGLLLPLLKHLIDTSRPEDLLPFHDLFRAVLSAYVIRYVQAEPQLYTDWKREKRGCGCGVCERVDKFIVNPAAKVYRFKMTKKGRKHVRRRLMWHGQYELRTSQEGDRRILTITKTLNANQAKKKSWQERATQGTKSIKGLGSETLMRALLGADFEAIWSLDVEVMTPMNQAAQPLSPITNRKRAAATDPTTDSD